MTGLHVVYVLLRFPCLTESFIAEEIRHMHARGINLHVYSLLRPRDRVIHPVAQPPWPRVHYAPGIFSCPLWLAQVHYLLKAPGTYFRLLTAVLREPAPDVSSLLKRTYVFLQGVWLARQLRHASVDLIHAHFAWLSAAAGLVASQLLGLPFTVTTHAYDIYSTRNDLLALTSRYADRIITISKANRLAILEANPELSPAKVEVVHCGIDLDCFHPPPARPANKILQITAVGSLLPKKGHEYLIRACGDLQAQHVDFYCVIVGSGALERTLEDLIRELGLKNRVTLAGARPPEWIRARLAESDLFVLPCITHGIVDRDGIPVAIMEAMAMGVPAISTSISGIPELVRNEETGLLVPECNAAQLASAMIRLANDAGLRHRVATNGLALVDSEYNITKTTMQLQRVFERSIRPSHGPTGHSV